MPSKNSTLRKRARQLKKAGVIDYDLRKRLTPAQKAVITRKWRGTERSQYTRPWGKILTNPDIVTRTVSPKKAKLMKSLGYAVVGRRVFIDSEGARSVHIRGNKIIKVINDYKTVDDFVIGRENLLDTLKRYSNKKLPKGTTLTVRIGSNGRFRRRFASYNALLNYLSRWKPRDKFTDKDELIGHMTLIHYRK